MGVETLANRSWWLPSPLSRKRRAYLHFASNAAMRHEQLAGRIPCCYPSNMKAVAILSQRVAPGKTTLALHIAVAAEAAKLSTVVIDLDPQASAAGWKG